MKYIKLFEQYISEGIELTPEELNNLESELKGFNPKINLSLPKSLVPVFGKNITPNVSVKLVNKNDKYPRLYFYVDYNETKDGNKLYIKGSGDFELSSLSYSSPSWNVEHYLNNENIDKKQMQPKLKSFINTKLRKELLKIVNKEK